MTNMEKEEYFCKYKDKNGNLINLGDVALTDDGKFLKIRRCIYGKPSSGKPIQGIEQVLNDKKFEDLIHNEDVKRPRLSYSPKKISIIATKIELSEQAKY